MNKLLMKKITLAQMAIDYFIGNNKRAPKSCIEWSGGKDSTVLLHIVKNMYKGLPIPVVFIDSRMEFKEVSEFIIDITRLWNIPLLKVLFEPEDVVLIKKSNTIEEKKQQVRRAVKRCIQQIRKKHRYAIYLNGVRWYEGYHCKEYVREVDGIKFLHPLLHFTDEDIWRYIQFYNVPYVKLYDEGYKHLESEYIMKAALGD